MGAPKRIRKKFEKPGNMWNKERIERDHSLRDTYGLKKLAELWKVSTEVSRIRRNAREVLSGRVSQDVGNNIIARLSSYGIITEGGTLDDLLSVTPEKILDRRLQSIVFRKGLARTSKQARQLISHGYIAINGRRIKSPGYMVKKNEEDQIAYYRPISLEQQAPGVPASAPAPQSESAAAPAA